MQQQRPTHVRTRCKRHGLVVNNDGACRLCKAGRPPAGWGRVAMATVLVATSVGAVVIAVYWRLGRFRADAEPVQDDRSIATRDDPVRLTFSVAPTATVATPEPVAVEHVETVEDGLLGRPILQPRALRSAAPAPPRASVDPEPLPPEDPRDFDLPSRP